jgi:orotidine-5'-phosphate decarboxylase
VKAERLRLCVALDVVDADTAKKVTRLLAEHVDVFKIGLQLFCAEGPSVIGAIRDAGAQEIFLDLKLHDIPNTVAGAVKSARRHAVDYLTVHTGGGRAMLEAAQSEAGPVQLLGVTVLTSLSDGELAEVGHTSGTEALVERRAALAASVGLSGVVCSPLEVARVASIVGTSACIVTPGIRLDGDALGDQRRVATPERALADGATMLVIGRPILAAPDPIDAARAARERVRGSR